MHLNLQTTLVAATLLRPNTNSRTNISTSGCNKHHATGYSSNLNVHQLTSKGVLRNYTIYVPSTYNNANSNTAYPVIVDYHGSGGDGNQQHRNSLYDKYTDDYLLVYPNGYGRHWQGPNYTNPIIDDLQFTTDLLAHLRDEYCIDTNRVYASGKSNGGGFVDTLACSSHGDEFAAFAMASAALYTDLEVGKCPFERAIMEAHGVQDNTISYAPTEDGHGGPLPQVAEWVTWWADRDGCDAGGKANVDPEAGYNLTTYSCQGFENVVNHYKVFDLDHCWPSSTGKNFDYENPRCDDYSLDYTPAVLNFYAKWTLTTAPSAPRRKAT